MSFPKIEDLPIESEEIKYLGSEMPNFTYNEMPATYSYLGNYLGNSNYGSLYGNYAASQIGNGYSTLNEFYKPYGSDFGFGSKLENDYLQSRIDGSKLMNKYFQTEIDQKNSWQNQYLSPALKAVQGLTSIGNMYLGFQNLKMQKQQLGLAKEQWAMTKDELARIQRTRKSLSDSYYA